MSIRALAWSALGLVLVLAIWPHVRLAVGPVAVMVPTGALIVTAMVLVNAAAILLAWRAVFGGGSLPRLRTVFKAA